MDYREVFRLRPRNGSFGTQEILRHLDSLPATARDVGADHSVILAPGPDQLEMVLKAKMETGNHSFATSLVTVAPEVVEVWNAYTELTIRRAQAFVQWMLDHYDCTITEENSVDVTDIAKGSAANLYPETLR